MAGGIAHTALRNHAERPDAHELGEEAPRQDGARRACEVGAKVEARAKTETKASGPARI